jgi:hypothetical protein
VLHKGFEARLLGLDVPTEVANLIAQESERPLTEEQREQLPIMQADAEIITDNLSDWMGFGTDFVPLMHEGKPMLEFEVRTPLPGWEGGFYGKIDAVLKHVPTGQITVADFKTLQAFPAEGSEIYAPQLPYYMYALRESGVLHCNRMAFVQVKSVPPKRTPKLREDSGTFDGIRMSTDGQFRWVPRYVSDAELNNTWAELQTLALSMSRFTPEYRYMSRSPFGCADCEYHNYCDVKISGGDVENVLKANYNCPPAALKVLLPEER